MSTVHGAKARSSVTPYRSRREAALRAGPFGDGPADPLDDLARQAIPEHVSECPGIFGPDGRWHPHCGQVAS